MKEVPRKASIERILRYMEVTCVSYPYSKDKPKRKPKPIVVTGNIKGIPPEEDITVTISMPKDSRYAYILRRILLCEETIFDELLNKPTGTDLDQGVGTSPTP